MKTGFWNNFFKPAIHRGSALGAIAALVVAVAARGDSVNFDNYASPTDNDLRNHFNSSETTIQTPSGGITGGAVQASAGASIYRTSFDPLAGLTTSVFFKYENLSTFPPAGLRGSLGSPARQQALVTPTGKLTFGPSFTMTVG